MKLVEWAAITLDAKTVQHLCFVDETPPLCPPAPRDPVVYFWDPLERRLLRCYPRAGGGHIWEATDTLP